MTVTPTAVSSLALSLCAALSSTPAAGQDAAAWGRLLRGTSTISWQAPPALAGDLRPILGRTATLGLAASGFTQASLLIGAQAHTGLPLMLLDHRLLLYVPQPFAVVPMSMQSGHAALSLPIPDDSNLLGLDLAMQAVTATPGHIGLSNLLVANLGEQGGAWSQWSYEFHGTAAAQQRTSHGSVYSGDVEDHGISIPVFSGANENVWLTIVADRPLTSPIEVRSGTDGRGELLGSTTRQSSVVSIVLPPAGLTHVYLHNTDRARGVGVSWRVAVY